MKKSILFTLCLLTSHSYSAKLDLASVEKFSRGKDVVSNIFDLDRAGLRVFEMEESPWTSSFLPANRGFAANNYHQKTGKLISFVKGEFSYTSNRKKLIGAYNSELNPDHIATLSPADKYDLLIGNFRNETSFSYRLIEMADFLRARFGRHTQWTGMCHGWSPAAVSHPAPQKTITLTSADGKYQIPFYPNDIKALMTVAFANNTRAFMQDDRVQTSVNPEDWMKKDVMPMIGNACRKKGIALDRSTGRIRSKDDQLTNCEDVNPAFYHLIMTNLMGRHKQALVVDIDHNAKVNNHPTSGYAVSYFNVSDNRYYPTAKDAMMAVGSFEDKRAEFRHPQARYILGVEMNMTFVDYRFLGKGIAKSADIQKYKDRKFSYDLELDAQGNILGGEWVNDLKSRRRGRNTEFVEVAGDKPDFIWYAPKGLKPVAYFEKDLSGDWDPKNEALPQSWASAAISASYQTNLDFSAEVDENGNYPFRPQPEVIFSIVEKMLKLSRE